MRPSSEPGSRGPTPPTGPVQPPLDTGELVPESGISTRPSRSLGLLAAFFALAALGLMFVYSDGAALLEALRNVSWPRLLVPVALTLLSYVLMALSYEGIARAAGTPIGLWPMLRITFVSNTVNYLVATGGLSGFAFRMYFFTQHGIPMGNAVTISFVQGLLTNLTLLFFLAMGFYFLLAHASLGTAALVTAATMLGAFVLLTVLCLVLLVRPLARRRFLARSVLVGHRLARRVLPSHRLPRRIHLWQVAHNVNSGLDFMLSRWQSMLGPAGWIILDWLATLGVLKASFWCAGRSVPFAEVAVGFAIGMLASLVSLAPGGIGILEGSMTGVFATLGIPLETAVVAVLIFRFAYYAVPFLVSLLFFRGMLRASGVPVPSP
ncbi:MAG: YbhN family protein [Alphaproteobacteria bacterium]